MRDYFIIYICVCKKRSKEGEKDTYMSIYIVPIYIHTYICI
jgi:hypothetical protein